MNCNSIYHAPIANPINFQGFMQPHSNKKPTYICDTVENSYGERFVLDKIIFNNGCGQQQKIYFRDCELSAPPSYRRPSTPVKETKIRVPDYTNEIIKFKNELLETIKLGFASIKPATIVVPKSEPHIITKEVHVPVDRPVYVPQEKVKIVEVPMPYPVEKPYPVPGQPIIVEKQVMVPAPKVEPVIHEKIIEKPKYIEVPKIVQVEKIIEKPHFIEKEKIVEVPKYIERPQIVEKIVEVPKYIEKPRIVEKIVHVKQPAKQPININIIEQHRHQILAEAKELEYDTFSNITSNKIQDSQINYEYSINNNTNTNLNKQTNYNQILNDLVLMNNVDTKNNLNSNNGISNFKNYKVEIQDPSIGNQYLETSFDSIRAKYGVDAEKYLFNRKNNNNQFQFGY